VRRPANLADLVNVVNLAKLVGRSAKLELRLVDTQRFDAMVKRGWWNAKLRRGP
jgi:hypothetical protein